MISVKATTKALSATLIAVFMAALLFGTWLMMPADVQAQSDETNATTSNVTVQAHVSCGMPASWANGVEFGSVDPDHSDYVPTDNNYTMLAPATNNVDIDFYVMADQAMLRQGGADTIPLANYTWNMTTWATSPPAFNSTTALTTAYVEGTGCDGTSAGDNCTTHLWLDIPSGQVAGTYNNTLTIKCNQTD